MFVWKFAQICLSCKRASIFTLSSNQQPTHTSICFQQPPGVCYKQQLIYTFQSHLISAARNLQRCNNPAQDISHFHSKRITSQPRAVACCVELLLPRSGCFLCFIHFGARCGYSFTTKVDKPLNRHATHTIDISKNFFNTQQQK